MRLGAGHAGGDICRGRTMVRPYAGGLAQSRGSSTWQGRPCARRPAHAGGLAQSRGSSTWQGRPCARRPAHAGGLAQSRGSSTWQGPSVRPAASPRRRPRTISGFFDLARADVRSAASLRASGVGAHHDAPRCGARRRRHSAGGRTMVRPYAGGLVQPRGSSTGQGRPCARRPAHAGGLVQSRGSSTWQGRTCARRPAYAPPA